MYATREDTNDGLLMVLSTEHRRSPEEMLALAVSDREVSIVRWSEGLFEVLVATPVRFPRDHPHFGGHIAATINGVLREHRAIDGSPRPLMILCCPGCCHGLRTPTMPVSVPPRIRLEPDELLMPATPIAYTLRGGRVLIPKNTTLPITVRLPRRGVSLYADGNAVWYDRRFSAVCLRPLFRLTGCTARSGSPREKES